MMHKVKTAIAQALSRICPSQDQWLSILQVLEKSLPALNPAAAFKEYRRTRHLKGSAHYKPPLVLNFECAVLLCLYFMFRLGLSLSLMLVILAIFIDLPVLNAGLKKYRAHKDGLKRSLSGQRFLSLSRLKNNILNAYLKSIAAAEDEAYRYADLVNKAPYKLKLEERHERFAVLDHFYTIGEGVDLVRDYRQDVEDALMSSDLAENTSLDTLALRTRDLAPIYVKTSDLNYHTLILGSTGCGKTQCMQLLMAQAILRGDAVIFIDPKSDEGLLKNLPQICKLSGRGHDYRLIDLANYSHISLNPLQQFSRYNEIAERLTANLPDSGSAASFKAASHTAILAAVCLLSLEGKEITIAALNEIVSRHAMYKERLAAYFIKLTLRLNKVQVNNFAVKIFGEAALGITPPEAAPSPEAADAVSEDKSAQASKKTEEPAAKPQRGRRSTESAAAAQADEPSPADAAEEALAQNDESLSSTDANADLNASKPKRTRKSPAKKAPKASAGPKRVSAATLQSFYDYLVREKFIKADERITMVLNTALISAEYFTKTTSGARTILEKLSAQDLRNIFSGEGLVLSASEAADKGMIMHICLRNMVDTDLGRQAGKLILEELRSFAGTYAARSEGPKRRVSLFIDEASEVMNESLVQLLNKGRASNFAVTIATQTIDDIGVRTGNRLVANQILGNCNTLISLAILEEDTASTVSKSFGSVLVTRRSSVQSFSENSSGINYGGSKINSEVLAPLVPPELLLSLKPLTYVARLHSKRIVHGIVPILKLDNN